MGYIRGAGGDVALPVDFVLDVLDATAANDLVDVAHRWLPAIISPPLSDEATTGIVEATTGIVVVDASTSQLTAALHHDLDGSLAALLETTDPDDLLIGRVIRSDEPAMVSGLCTSDPSDIDLAGFAAAGFDELAVVPLGRSQLGLGALVLAQRSSALSIRDIDLLGAAAAAIGGQLGAQRETAERTERARTDDLVGCLARGPVLDELDAALTSGSVPPSLLYIDVDGFKLINDVHGHPTGDRVLCALGEIIDRHLTPADALGRLGGDEFLVVVAKDRNGQRATALAEAIGQSIAGTEVSLARIGFSASIGCATVRSNAPAQSNTARAAGLLHEADRAMYVAKSTGAGFAIFDEAMRLQTALVADIDKDLESTFDQTDFALHYQLIRDTASREVLGAEALLRWRTERNPPAATPLLLERIDRNRRTVDFTRWSLDAIARDWRAVRTRYPWFTDKAVSLNLSPRQLAWDGYVDHHLDTLERYGLEVGAIVIEVVESKEIEVDGLAEDNLRRLGTHGVIIALDDFGTGHNALKYFTRFPIHAIKFDQTLVEEVRTSETARLILSGLASMARDLQIVSLAEGIETESDAAECARLGITHGQGWHFGRPQPIAKLLDELADERSPADETTVDPAGFTGHPHRPLWNRPRSLT